MRTIAITTSSLLLAYGLFAQQNLSTTPISTVPRLVRISNTFQPADGQPASPMENVTLSIYRDELGGSPLWQETQNVAIDSAGRYNLLMGSTVNDGIPVELFGSSEPRWLGVKFNRNGEVEQPRTRLASVPYALKASDSETLGGRPAAAYLLADPAEGRDLSGTAATAAGAKAVAKPKSIVGTQGYIPVFTDATDDLGNSVMQQASGDIGIGTVPNSGATTSVSLDLRTYPFAQIGMAQTSDYMSFFASDTYGPAIYWDPAKDLRFGKGGTGLYNAFGFTEQMRIQSSTGYVGIGTPTPGSTLDVNGNINFSGVVNYQGDTLLVPNSGTASLALAGYAPADNNVAIGFDAYTEGNYSTAVGENAGLSGADNTSVGYSAGPSTSGTDNTLLGYEAGFKNVAGTYNTAVGSSALYTNVGGYYNTALGYKALYTNSGGSTAQNTAVGAQALYLTTGSGNIALGNQAGYLVGSGSNNIEIFNAGQTGDNGVIRIGQNTYQTQFFAAGIYGVNTSGIAVYIDSSGQLGTVASSRRYKEDIQDMGNATDGLMRLRPVTFRYKQPFEDGAKPIQYGLIAEEVDEVYPELVAHSADGQIETVKYQMLDSMLLNEVQKQQAEIKALQEQLRDLEAQREQNQSLNERLTKLEALLASATAGDRH